MLQGMFSKYTNHRYRKLLQRQMNPVQAQEEAFQRLKKRLAGTKVYELTELSRAKNLEDFAKMAEARTYKDYSDWIRENTNGVRGLLHSDSLMYVGLSSGTTNPTSKSIPYNQAMIDAWGRFQLNIVSILQSSSPVKFLEDKRMTWGSTPHLETLGNGIQAGYVSGFLAMRSPKIIQRNSYPKPESLMMTDMPAKMKRMAEELKGVDLRLVSAVPSYLLNVFETLRDEWGLENLSEAFPNLKTCLYSATAIHAWKDQINAIVGRELDYFGVYAATEGAFGYEIPQINGGVNGQYSFHLEDFVLLFRKFGEDGRVVTLRDLKPGDEVELLLSSPNGLINYSLGDALRITATKPYVLFEILGRIGQGMNVAAEKVSQQELSLAVERASRRLQKSVRHFFVRPGQSEAGRPAYVWTIALDQGEDVREWESAIDQALMQVNDDYREARLDLQFIDRPKVSFLPSQIVQNYFKAVGGKGQLKMRSIFPSEESFSEYLGQMQQATA